MERGRVPLIALDLWEHAYYLRYNRSREAYLDAFWHVLDWASVEMRFIKGEASGEEAGVEQESSEGEEEPATMESNEGGDEESNNAGESDAMESDGYAQDEL